MTFFEDRPGAGKVEELLTKAAERSHLLLMSVVNWGEVYHSVWRTRGEKAANEKVREIVQLPVEVVDADAELTRLAAALKAKHNLPYADCFAGALAQTRKAVLVTSDKDFERVASLIKVLWV
jgi:predicted nucleic acid-binding protein